MADGFDDSESATTGPAWWCPFHHGTTGAGQRAQAARLLPLYHAALQGDNKVQVSDVVPLPLGGGGGTGGHVSPTPAAALPGLRAAVEATVEVEQDGKRADGRAAAVARLAWFVMEGCVCECAVAEMQASGALTVLDKESTTPTPQCRITMSAARAASRALRAAYAFASVHVTSKEKRSEEWSLPTRACVLAREVEAAAAASVVAPQTMPECSAVDEVEGLAALVRTLRQLEEPSFGNSVFVSGWHVAALVHYVGRLAAVMVGYGCASKVSTEVAALTRRAAEQVLGLAMRSTAAVAVLAAAACTDRCHVEALVAAAASVKGSDVACDYGAVEGDDGGSADAEGKDAERGDRASSWTAINGSGGDARGFRVRLVRTLLRLFPDGPGGAAAFVAAVVDSARAVSDLVRFAETLNSGADDSAGLDARSGSHSTIDDDHSGAVESMKVAIAAHGSLAALAGALNCGGGRAAVARAVLSVAGDTAMAAVRELAAYGAAAGAAATTMPRLAQESRRLAGRVLMGSIGDDICLAAIVGAGGEAMRSVASALRKAAVDTSTAEAESEEIRIAAEALDAYTSGGVLAVLQRVVRPGLPEQIRCGVAGTTAVLSWDVAVLLAHATQSRAGEDGGCAMELLAFAEDGGFVAERGALAAAGVVRQVVELMEASGAAMVQRCWPAGALGPDYDGVLVVAKCCLRLVRLLSLLLAHGYDVRRLAGISTTVTAMAEDSSASEVGKQGREEVWPPRVAVVGVTGSGQQFRVDAAAVAARGAAGVTALRPCAPLFRVAGTVAGVWADTADVRRWLGPDSEPLRDALGELRLELQRLTVGMTDLVVCNADVSQGGTRLCGARRMTVVEEIGIMTEAEGVDGCRGAPQVLVVMPRRHQPLELVLKSILGVVRQGQLGRAPSVAPLELLSHLLPVAGRAEGAAVRIVSDALDGDDSWGLEVRVPAAGSVATSATPGVQRAVVRACWRMALETVQRDVVAAVRRAGRASTPSGHRAVQQFLARMVDVCKDCDGLETERGSGLIPALLRGLFDEARGVAEVAAAERWRDVRLKRVARWVDLLVEVLDRASPGVWTVEGEAPAVLVGLIAGVVGQFDTAPAGMADFLMESVAFFFG
ncbi:hypothetical protein HK405_006054, partial [Cladochytrium tenue]